MTSFKTLSMICLLFLVQISCESVHSKNRKEFQLNSYSIARDETNHIVVRLEAAQKLSVAEKLRLQAEILQRLPGNWDRHTLDNIQLLAEIGDEDSVKKIVEIMQAPVEIPDKILTVGEDAIDEIRSRCRGLSGTTVP